jgi:hypothetical protein
MYTPGACGADESVASGNIGEIALNFIRKTCVVNNIYHLTAGVIGLLENNFLFFNKKIIS